MGARANKVMKACEKAYDKLGVQGAIDTAQKMGVKLYAYCVPCESDQPSIEKYCCVCGSHSELLPTFKGRGFG